MTAQAHRRVDVAVIDQPSVEHRLTKLLEGQSPELTAGFATAPHRDSPGSVDVGEAGCLQEAEKASTECRVEAVVLGEDDRVRVQNPGENSRGVSVHSWIGYSGHEVQLLQDEAAAGSQRPDEASQGVDRVGKPGQHQPGMDEVEAGGW